MVKKVLSGKDNTNGFQKNPQNINRKGQPRKGLSAVNHELKAKGYEPATKQDVQATYKHLLQLGQEDLEEIHDDKSKPMMARILAKNMLSKKGFDIIEKMLDRSQWKPIQMVETKENEEQFNKKVDLSDKTSIQLEIMRRKLLEQ